MCGCAKTNNRSYKYILFCAHRALAKLRRHDQVERELFTLADHAGEQADVCVSALEIVI